MKKINKIILSLLIVNGIQWKFSSVSVIDNNSNQNINEEQGGSSDNYDEQKDGNNETTKSKRMSRWFSKHPGKTAAMSLFGMSTLVTIMDASFNQGKIRKKFKTWINGAPEIVADKKDEQQGGKKDDQPNNDQQSGQGPINQQPGNQPPVAPNPAIKTVDHTNQQISLSLSNDAAFNTFKQQFTHEEFELLNIMTELQDKLSDVTVVADYLAQDPIKAALLTQLKNEFKDKVGVILEKDSNDADQRTQQGFYYFESLNETNKGLKNPSIGIIFDQVKLPYTEGKFMEEMTIYNYDQIYSVDNVKKTIDFIKKYMPKIEEFITKHLSNLLKTEKSVADHLKQVNDDKIKIKKEMGQLFTNVLSTNIAFKDYLKKDFESNITSIEQENIDVNQKTIKKKAALYEIINQWDKWLYDIASNDAFDQFKKLEIKNLQIDGSLAQTLCDSFINEKYNTNQNNWDSEKYLGFKDDNLLDFVWAKHLDLSQGNLDLNARIKYFTQYMNYIKNLFKELYLIHKNHTTSSDPSAADFQQFLAQKTKALEDVLTASQGQQVVIHWDTLDPSKTGEYHIVIKANSITPDKQDAGQLNNYDFFISEQVIVDIVRTQSSIDYTLSSNFFAHPWKDTKNIIDICKIKLNKTQLDAIHKEIIKKAESDANINLTLADAKKFNDSLINQIKTVMANPNLAAKITAKKKIDRTSPDNKMLDWINFLCIINQSTFDKTNFDATMNNFKFDASEIQAIEAIQQAVAKPTK